MTLWHFDIHHNNINKHRKLHCKIVSHERESNILVSEYSKHTSLQHTTAAAYSHVKYRWKVCTSVGIKWNYILRLPSRTHICKTRTSIHNVHSHIQTHTLRVANTHTQTHTQTHTHTHTLTHTHTHTQTHLNGEERPKNNNILLTAHKIILPCYRWKKKKSRICPSQFTFNT